ncbi:ninein-like protein, partial [Dinothrombium tinctorium]
LNYEQLVTERDKLRINIAEANARADLLAQEVDEHHAKIEKSTKSQLWLLEKKHQEQMRSLEEELKKERELFAAQTQRLKQDCEKELSLTFDHQNKLKQFLDSIETDNKRLERELRDANQRCAELLKANIDLQKEVEELAAVKSKELKDENDELRLQVGNLRQELNCRQLQKKQKTISSSKRILSHRKNSQQSSVDSIHRSPEKGFKRRGNNSSASSDDEAMNEQPMMEVEIEAEDVSTSLTISESDLFKEMSEIKARLTQEIEERDRLIDEKDEIYQRLESVHKKLEKQLNDQVNIRENFRKAIQKLKSFCNDYCETTLYKQIKDAIFKLLLEYEHGSADLETHLAAVIDHFIDLNQKQSSFSATSNRLDRSLLLK